jgi:hypothetical protein
MVCGMLNPEMIEDTAGIVNEALKDKVQVNLIINNRAGGTPSPLLTRKAPESPLKTPPNNPKIFC